MKKSPIDVLNHTTDFTENKMGVKEALKTLPTRILGSVIEQIFTEHIIYQTLG